MNMAKMYAPVRLFKPTVTSRLFDPMPLPRNRASLRRARIAFNRNTALTDTGTEAPLAGKTGRNTAPPAFTRRVKRIPLNA